MALPAPGNPISASMINTEADRSSSFTAPLSGNSSTPQVGSLVKIYSPPDSSVDQNAPHKFSEFYSKSWNGRNSIQFKQYYYNSSNSFPSATQACVSSAWYGGNGTTVYYTGILGVGTIFYTTPFGFTRYSFTSGQNYSFKTAPNSTETLAITADSLGVVQSYSVCPSLTAFWTANANNPRNAPDSFSSSQGACAQRYSYSFNYFAYHTGVNTQPVAGDFVYLDQTLTTPLMATNNLVWYQGSDTASYVNYGEVINRYAFNMNTGSGSSNLNGPGTVKANITDCSRQTIRMRRSDTGVTNPSINLYFYYQASIGDAVNLTTNDILYTDSALTTTYPTAQTWLFDAGTSAKNPCYNTISCPSSISLNSSGVITNKTCNINPCS